MACVHHWLIAEDGRSGRCRKCRAERTFPAPRELDAQMMARFRSMALADEQRERIRAAAAEAREGMHGAA